MLGKLRIYKQNSASKQMTIFRTDKVIAELTKEGILDKINNWGFSELYLSGRYMCCKKYTIIEFSEIKPFRGIIK